MPKTPSATSLRGETPPAVAAANLAALQARPCLAPDWTPRFVHSHSREFRDLRAAYSYFGEVRVDVTGAPPLVMLNHNDDLVAATYFFFGRDAYESLSVRLFAGLSVGADAVLDIGAYTGLFGLVAAKTARGAHVSSFEPIPHIAARARLNGALNRLGDYVVAQKAVGEAPGAAELTLYGGHAGTTGASLAEKPRSDVGRIEVEVTTIDEYASGLGGRRIGLIKLDTEGAEVAAMAGGAGVFREHGPIVLSEILNDAALAAQCDAMAAHGYDAWHVDERQRKLKRVRADAPPQSYGNVLFARGRDISRARAIAVAFRSGR